MIGKIGSIRSWTIIRVPPANFSEQAPYPVVIVVLDGGKQICAQLVDWRPEHLAMGQKVVVIIRRVAEPSTEGLIPYGIKAKPVDV